MNPIQTLEQFSDLQGWNTASQLNVCMLYIQSLSNSERFYKFVSELVDEENQLVLD